MKLGGTSVGPTESIDGVARIVAAAVEEQAGGADAGGGIAEAVLGAAWGQAQGLPRLERRGDCEGCAGGRRQGRHKACPCGNGERIAMAVRATVQ